MKFKVFASFVGVDWDGNHRPDPDQSCQFGWTDHEIIVRSNSKANARKKILNWAKKRGATQSQIWFVSDEVWKTDKCFKTKIIK